MTDWIEPPAATPLHGDEPLAGTGASVADFWRFAMSDLRTNAVRGLLAEFLVARAVGSTAARVEWDAWDVTTPSGIRVEVKASGYLQAWRQRELSRIVFTGLDGHAWRPGEAMQATRGFNADVYVFCVHTARAHADYDPLDVTRWTFYVLPVSVVAAARKSQLSLAAIRATGATELTYDQIAGAVEAAGRTQGDHPSPST